MEQLMKFYQSIRAFEALTGMLLILKKETIEAIIVV
jgi:hypothetical protein